MSHAPAGRADVIVVGGGVAALRSAVAAAEAGARVLLLSKGRVGKSGCSAQIERGIEYCAINSGPYTTRGLELLADEYLRTGMGINSRDVVESFVTNLPAEHERLARLALPILGAHRAHQRLRWTGQYQGVGLIGRRGFARTLLGSLSLTARKLGVTMRDRCQVVSIAREGQCARGVVAMDLTHGGLEWFASPSIIIATGGAGNVFPFTTNPRDIVGDGLALARRCGARLTNMEFYSYYPLSVGRMRRIYLIHPILTAGTLTDARGGTLRWKRTRDGDAVDHLLSVRDACRWIEKASRRGSGTAGGEVRWDGRRVPARTLEARIPFTCGLFRRAGIDLKRDSIPMTIHAHQAIGRIEIDALGRTRINGLFAAGEVAAGLHGALRLNGSGITAGLVLGAVAGRTAAAYARGSDLNGANPDVENPGGRDRIDGPRLRRIHARVQSAMGPVLVVRREDDLQRARRTMRAAIEEVEATRFDPSIPSLASLREDVRASAEAAAVMVEHSLLRRKPLGFFLPH
ncbi:MAG: FAD-binding protein [Acidobacteria bacterium]|nr:FAD-binding protein [Acidobacteriota bacterium]